MPLSREPTIRMQLLAAQASLHAEACATDGRPDARLERCALRVDEALAALAHAPTSDLRGLPPEDWAAP